MHVNKNTVNGPEELKHNPVSCPSIRSSSGRASAATFTIHGELEFTNKGLLSIGAHNVFS